MIKPITIIIVIIYNVTNLLAINEEMKLILNTSRNFFLDCIEIHDHCQTPIRIEFIIVKLIEHICCLHNTHKNILFVVGFMKCMSCESVI